MWSGYANYLAIVGSITSMVSTKIEIINKFQFSKKKISFSFHVTNLVDGTC